MNSTHFIDIFVNLEKISSIGIEIRGCRSKSSKNNIKIHEYLFGEDQSRYILEVKERNIKEVCKILKKNSVYYDKIGITQKDNFDVDNEFKINLNELIKANNFWFQNYFNGNI